MRNGRRLSRSAEEVNAWSPVRRNPRRTAFAIRAAGTVAVRADVSWQSRVFFTPVNDAIETQRAYGLLHVRAGFEPRSRRWEVPVYVRNLGNQDYITGTANVPIPAITGRPGDPRQWGTQFTLRR
jgi:outer membrane receptor protein involved in Fe transport